MRIDVLTLFPEMFTGFLSESIIKRAIESNKINVNLIDFREFSESKHKKVDDYPYGGGQGMVLRVEPIYKALKSIPNVDKALKIMMSPQGEPYKQAKAEELATYKHIVILCGHYEGFDERIRDLVDIEISIGDYVLTGGELGSMVVIDSVTRLLDNVLGNKLSHIEDSFSNGLLEGPQYTRPEEFEGKSVPEVLLSGHHKNIEEFRKFESLKRTYLRRPDLLKDMNEEQKEILKTVKNSIDLNK